MIVEFIGVSGVGKTTLATAVADCLVADGLDVRLRFRDFAPPLRLARRALIKSLFISRYLLGHPRAALATARLVGASAQPGAREAVALTQSLWYLESICALENESCDVLLLHQGFCQLLGSLAYSTTGDREALLARGYPLIRKADAYVHVSASTEVVAARLSRRTRVGSRVHRDLDDGGAAIARSFELVEWLRARLRADGHTVLDYAYAEGDALDAVARRLAVAIRAAREGGGTAPVS